MILNGLQNALEESALLGLSDPLHVLKHYPFRFPLFGHTKELSEKPVTLVCTIPCALIRGGEALTRRSSKKNFDITHAVVRKLVPLSHVCIPERYVRVICLVSRNRVRIIFHRREYR